MYIGAVAVLPTYVWLCPCPVLARPAGSLMPAWGTDCLRTAKAASKRYAR